MTGENYRICIELILLREAVNESKQYLSSISWLEKEIMKSGKGSLQRRNETVSKKISDYDA